MLSWRLQAVQPKMWILLGALSLLSAAAAQDVCYEGWYAYKGHCYAIGEEPLSWLDAKSFCNFFDAQLAEIEDTNENSMLQTLLKTKTVAYGAWVGGTDMFQEGIWMWLSTRLQIYPFTDWSAGDPQGGADADCLALWKANNFQWTDDTCDTTLNFICERSQTQIIGAFSVKQTYLIVGKAKWSSSMA